MSYYSDVSWAYKDPTTVQKFTQMSDNTVFVVRNRMIGCEVDITGTSTAIIKGGSMAIDSEWLTNSDTVTLSADNASHWITGTSLHELSATAWYIVAWASGNNWTAAYTPSAPAYSDTNSGTATGPKCYDRVGSTWYRYVGAVHNDSGSNLIKYKQDSNYVEFVSGMVQVRSGVSNSAWATISCQRAVSKLSTRINIHATSQDDNTNCGAWVTINGGTYVATWQNGFQGYHRVTGEIVMRTDTSQQIAFQTDANDDTGTVFVRGYFLDGRS